MCTLGLNQFTKEQLSEMSLIEMAYEILKSQKQPASFKEILDEIISTIGLTEKEVKSKIAQFYTDLNIDGRFLSMGDNRWGLRVWYPVDQSEEEVVTPTKPKKKKAKKVVDEDEDLDIDFDDVEEDELDYDDILDDDDEDIEDLDELDDEEEFEDELDEELEDEDLLADEDEEFEELEDEEELVEEDEEDL